MKVDPRFGATMDDLRVSANAQYPDTRLLDLCDQYLDLDAEWKLPKRECGVRKRPKIEQEQMVLLREIIPITAFSGLGREAKWSVLSLLLGHGTMAGALAASMVTDFSSYAMQKRAI